MGWVQIATSEPTGEAAEGKSAAEQMKERMSRENTANK